MEIFAEFRELPRSCMALAGVIFILINGHCLLAFMKRK